MVDIHVYLCSSHTCTCMHGYIAIDKIDCVPILLSFCRHLSVKNCYRIEKIGVNVLCISFSNLLTLDISECSNMTPDCLTLIAKHMTQLQHLNIANCAHMESVESADELLSSLQANCTHLKLLTVSAAQLHLDEDPDSESNSTRLKDLPFKILII